MPDKDKTKEVAKVTPPQLPAIPDPKELEAIIRESFEGVQPSFQTIKIPTGGSLAWEIPGDEEPEIKKEFLGVIMDHYPTRVYWPGDFEGGVIVHRNVLALMAVLASNMANAPSVSLVNGDRVRITEDKHVSLSTGFIFF